MKRRRGEMSEESVLIEKASRGDKESFERIINTYKNYVFAIILNFIKDNEEAQNISQEVFLQVYVSLPNFKEDNFKAWISRITTNKSIDYLRRKRSRVKEVEIEKLEGLDLPYERKQDDQPELLLINKENKEEIKREIENLPEIYRESINKFYFEEKSYEQIALDQGVSKKTIESRLYRARLLLKKNWRDRDDSL